IARLLPVEYREPHGRLRRVGPVDPVLPVRRDLDPVAGADQARLCFVGKTYPRRAGEQQYPFGLGLVVPETGRAGLAERDAALDAHARRGEDRLGDFARASIGKITQQVHDADASTAATARCQPAYRSSRSAL